MKSQVSLLSRVMIVAVDGIETSVRSRSISRQVGLEAALHQAGSRQAHKLDAMRGDISEYAKIHLLIWNQKATTDIEDAHTLYLCL